MTTAEAKRTTNPTEGIMSRLRVETRALHDAAENKAFNDALVKGRLPKGAYAAYLGQLYHMHRAFEPPLRRLRDARQDVAAIVADEQFQVPYLERDLEFLGVDRDGIEPFGSSRRFAERVASMAEGDPVALLGVFYVFEGSNNGSRFVARAVRRAYGLENGDGTRYLDPYGERQPFSWREFKQRMDATGFDDAHCDAIVSAARATFEAVIEMFEELSDAWMAGENAALASCDAAGRA